MVENTHDWFQMDMAQHLATQGAKVETEYKYDGNHRADIVALFPDQFNVAIECGQTSKRKMKKLKKQFVLALHVPHSFDFAVTVATYRAVSDLIKKEHETWRRSGKKGK